MPRNENEKKISIGSWLSIGSPYVAEMMATSGFEWLVIDMEHSAANGLTETQRLIQVIDLASCRPFVRVPSGDPSIIKVLLDAGAHGIIAPMINTPEEAQSVVNAARYAPHGNRGVGLWRAQDYGRNFDGYREWYEREGVLLVQIEHILGVENLAEILEIEGVDGFIIGPYDLSSSLGIPGEFNNAKYLDALQQVKDIVKQTDKLVGIHIVYPDRELLKMRIEEGYNFIAYGVDFTFLTTIIDDETEFMLNLIQK
ncbi:MAG: 2,4-dihydroxyhept-2-ene-1,7-dioic acid aldolase [Anaerolineales bacterium]|nr:2,4-dihydroxyhept-2-ene-1,7-dioic acid aldolase [Anaerolineales bacterium]